MKPRGGESCTVANIFFSSLFLLHTRSRVEMGINGRLSSSKAAVAARLCDFGGDLRGKQKQGNKRLEGFSSVQLGVLQLILQAQKHTETHRGVSATSAKATYHHTHAHTHIHALVAAHFSSLVADNGTALT